MCGRDSRAGCGAPEARFARPRAAELASTVLQYHVQGRLHVVMDDGSEAEYGPGDVSLLPPGHDAWVVGNEPAVVVDFQGMIDYAKAHTH